MFNCADAQLTNNYRFINFGVKDGLNDKFIYCAQQDNRGYMWFGTATGLYRYDGHVFKHINSTADIPGRTISNILQVMYKDERGILWLGGINALQWYDPEKNLFWTPNLTNPAVKKMADARILSFTPGKDGHKWIGTGNYFFRFNPADSSFTHFQNFPPGASALTIYVQELKNDIYAVHQEGIYCFSDNGVFKAFYKLPFGNINDVFWNEASSSFWLSTRNGGLQLFNPYTHNYSAHPNNEFFVSDRVNTCLVGKDGTIYCGGYKLSMVLSNNQQLRFSNEEKSAYGMNASTIARFYSDRENNIWICSYFGLTMLPWQNNQVKEINLLDKVSGNGVEPYNVFNIPGTGDMLITNTSTSGAIIYNTAADSLATIVNPAGLTIDEKNINGCISTPDSSIFLSDDKHLFRYFHRQHQMVPVQINDQHGLPMSSIRKSITDKKGNIYISTNNNGFYRWNYNTKELVHYSNRDINTQDSNVREITPCCIDRNNNCWLASGNGAYIYYPVSASFRQIDFKNYAGNIPGGECSDITEDKRGHIWIVSRVNGLYEWYTENGKEVLKNYNRYSGIGLPSDLCWNIKSVPGDSCLWISNNAGVLKFDPIAKRVLAIFNKQNGLAEDDGGYTFNILPGNLLAQLYYSKLNIIDLNHYHTNNFLPVVQFNAVKILDSEYVYHLPQNDAAIELNSNENFLQLEFAALVFNNSNQNQYAYRLDGIDKDWIYCGTQNTASYAGLKPGSYTFRVKAANSDGYWGKETTLRLVINAPFYARWWFLLFCTILLGAAIFLWNRFKVNNARKEEQLKNTFQQQIAEMEMKALRAQMNPHFIFNSLNSIQKYILKNDHFAASQYLTKFSRLIRLILDHSNQSTILLGSEIDLLKLYVEMESMRFDNRFEYSIIKDVDVRAEVISIPSMLIQPYVENAIWHGLLHKDEKGKLLVHFSMTDTSQLQVLIEDNGIGREKAAELKSKQVLKKKSYGMQITEDRIGLINRIMNIHATCMIEDLKNSDGSAAGTRVIINIPVKLI